MHPKHLLGVVTRVEHIPATYLEYPKGVRLTDGFDMDIIQEPERFDHFVRIEDYDHDVKADRFLKNDIPIPVGNRVVLQGFETDACVVNENTYIITHEEC